MFYRQGAGAGLGRVLRHLEERNVMIITAYKESPKKNRLKPKQSDEQANREQNEKLKFVFTPKTVIRSWGAKDKNNRGEVDSKIIVSSGVSKFTGGGIEALLEDYDEWVKELKTS